MLQLWFTITDFDPDGPRSDLYWFPKKENVVKGNFQSYMSYGDVHKQTKAAVSRAGYSTVDIAPQSLRKGAWFLGIAKSRGLIGEHQQMRVLLHRT
jgi:hypothetical protein